MSNQKNLIFITSEFPYGTGETFIENEFPYLLQSFDNVLIITNAPPSNTSRLLDKERVQVVYFPYELTLTDKLKSILGLLKKAFWEEISIIKNTYHLPLNQIVLNTLLAALQKKGKIADFITSIIAEKKWQTKNTFVYSYWLNDMALGVAEMNVRYPDIRAFSRAHGWDVYMERHPHKYLPLRNFLLNNLDVCYAISDNGKNYLQTKFIAAADKIKLARLGTKPHAPKKEAFMNRNDVPFTIISCSNIISIKRIHLIIEALALLPEKNIRWVHFGDGILEDNIKALASKKLQQASGVKFEFKGRVSNEELMTYYQNNLVHLFVNVSETEGVPVSIMEAMSFGIPCVATDVGGNSEIANTTTGALLNPNPTTKEIAEAITTFIELNQADYIKLRENTYDMWLNNFNAEKNYPEFMNRIF